MRFIRRLLERFGSAAALPVGVGLMIGGGVASCSSDGDRGGELDDAGDASSAPDDGSAGDAGLDAPVISRDAAPFDGGPLPVVCSGSPCATSLVTTWGIDEVDPGEGFCALLADGTVACWGANAAGQLGRGDDGGVGDSPTAARVVGLSDIVELDHTCARDGSGGVWCWGKGANLRNDAGAATRELSPVKLPLPPAKRVAMGRDVACAVVDDELLCWGDNYRAQVASVDPNTPPLSLPPHPIASLSAVPIRDVHLGRSSFVRREDGVTMSWGQSIGLGRVSSLRADSQPRPIALDGIVSLDVTDNTACATVGGTGYCWGCVTGIQRPGEQGDCYVARAVPAPIVAPEPVIQIATTRGVDIYMMVAGGFVDQRQRWCAVGASGAVYCWGRNASGEAGDGTKDHAYEAVKVVGLPDVTAAQVRTTATATCALLTNGKVYCWGANYYGQLGNGRMRAASRVPQEVVLP